MPDTSNAEPMTYKIFDSDIEKYIKIFCEISGIDDMTREPQTRWNAALLYVRRELFGNSDILKSDYRCYNTYDMDKVSTVCDIYIYLCYLYDKEISILGFTKLTGISQDCIYEWARGERKLSAKGCEIYKKLTMEREESLSNRLVAGKQNPVGILGILNRHYAWNMPGVGREPAQQPLTAADLPKLGNMPEMKQLEGE